MELDDFKLKEKGSVIPEQNGSPEHRPGLNGLIGELKVADDKGRKTIMRFGTIIIMLLAIYTSISASRSGGPALGYRVLSGAFCLILLYFFWIYQMFRKIDYTAPVMIFLKKAERRYKFMSTADWFIVIPLLIILGFGGGLIVYYSFLKYFENVTLPVLIYAIFFMGVIILGFWASKKNWKKEKGELLNRIREMIREIE